MMDGIRFYTAFEAHIPVFFPDGKEQCKYCIFARYEQPFDRYYCRAKIEYNWIENIKTRPDWCPLIRKEEDKDEQFDREGDTGDEVSGA